MAGRGGKHGDITGAVGVPPPPGAPIETAQPLSPAAVADAAAKAAANATELPPFNPKADATSPAVVAARAADVAAARGVAPGRTAKARPSVTGPVAQTTPQNAAIAAEGSSGIILTDAPDTPRMPPGDTAAVIASMGEAVLAAQADVDAADVAAGVAAGADDVLGPRTNAPIEDIGVPPAVAPALAPPKIEGKLGEAARNLLNSRARSAQPAASNTDTPSRGLPTEVTDPGKRITGGFGDAIDQQYFPLDGSELRAMVTGILRFLEDQMANDLRFSVALVYPRVRAQVTIAIQGYTSEMDFELTRGAEHTKTPIDVAEATGATPVAFTVDGTIEEMGPDGESLMPPNAIREGLGLQIPRKQRVATPSGYAVVDRVS